MLKLFTFICYACVASCSLAAASVVYAAPNLLSLPLPLLKSVEVHEPALAKVGDLVEHVPTAVSHQSSTIVHSHAPRLSPILAPATAVRSYAPLLESRAVHLGPAAAYVHAHAPYVWPQHAAAFLRYNNIAPYI